MPDSTWLKKVLSDASFRTTATLAFEDALRNVLYDGKPPPDTLTERQFHLVWTEAVGRDGYHKPLFQGVLAALKRKGVIRA